ncbi:MAG: HD domain-containing protein [Clostridiales bacterium]|nr:HD domain-containing protein [Clostridiales bacterium]
MGRMRLLRGVASGQVEGFCLIKSVAIRQNVKGVDYLDLVLMDVDGECIAKLWDYNVHSQGAFAAEDLVKVRATINIYKDAEQLKIERIRHAMEEECNLSDLLPGAPLNMEDAFDELLELAEGFGNKGLREITRTLLTENRERFKRYPAAVKLHHATIGGLLHHTLAVTHLAQSFADLYPQLNRELLLAGAMLHDIGKLTEMDVGSLGLAGGYTAQGQLLGHIQIGANLVLQTAERVSASGETAMLLAHLLLSHHGTAEFGSPKLPMVPEADILALCDLADARMYEFFSALDGVSPGGFSEKQWALDNRQIYQARNLD